MHIDDSLDVFAVHGIGGIQCAALGVSIVWSGVAMLIIALVVKAVMGLRVTEDQEYAGMDRSEHGENAYPMEP